MQEDFSVFANKHPKLGKTFPQQTSEKLAKTFMLS